MRTMTQNAECPICFEHLLPETIVKTDCNHVFHKGCLDFWLKDSNTCPYCRFTLQAARHVKPLHPVYTVEQFHVILVEYVQRRSEEERRLEEQRRQIQYQQERHNQCFLVRLFCMG